MASSSSSSSSSSLSTRVRNYDVFLSFRGGKPRHKIVSYLYETLCREGIYTFKDDRKLEPGDNISNQLIDAIKTSWFAVVVISENYATSKWCLDELQLIMELHGKNLIRVVPIFYEVEPSDVRHLTGTFEAAFQKHEKRDTAPKRVSQWKIALNKVSHVSGFHSRTSLDEAAMISEAVRSISRQLLKMRQPSEVDYVGMDAHMVKMHFLLNMGSENEVLMIGIWGMGGVGKTTIANCLYDQFSNQFKARYFEKDIKKIHKDKSPTDLQKEFLVKILRGQHIDFPSDVAGSQEIKARLGHQKVLVVLDGVDKVEQVHALAKETSWFGPGSRIIITTRDMGLLNSCGVNNVYEVKCWDDKDALQFFKKLAFGGSPTPDGFEQVFIRASRLAHGLPSALVSYASYLSEKKTTEMWDAELDILKETPHENVEKILRYSYDGLDNLDKIAFLHVACLFNGYPFNHVTSLFDAGLPRLNHLTLKSLISITTDKCINMHFLVVQTGREIVRQECQRKPFRQRFLWDSDEIYSVLDNKTGTEEIEGVTLDMGKMRDTLSMSNEVFKVMRSIKFLKFFQQHLGDMKSNVQLRSNEFYFPPNLRLLHWDVYPLKTLPSRFRHYDLVEVNLRYSNLKSLWDESVKLPSLRRIDVTGSRNLIKLPNLSTAVGFEELTIEGCLRLQQIPESLNRLTRLKKLNAIQCDILGEICIQFTARSVEISGNNRVIVALDIPKDLSIEGQLKVDLGGLGGHADHISISCKQEIYDELVMTKHITLSDVQSLNIKRFRYRESWRYRDIYQLFECYSFLNIPSLRTLKLVNLKMEEIPDNIGGLLFLEKVDLSGNDFVHLPATMGELPKLKYLSLHNCRKITSLPQLTQVETLILSDCVCVRLLKLRDWEAWRTYCLLELWLDNCKNVLDLSHQLRRFTRLTYLDLSRHNFVTLPSSITELSSLGTLYINNCKKLISVEELPQSLEYLYAHGCDSLKKVSLSPNHSIKHLDLIHCPRLNREEHEHLMDLIYDGQSQEAYCQRQGSRGCACLPETGVSSDSGSETSSKNLELLDLSDAVYLKELITQGCKRLKRIPDAISNLIMLTMLDVSDCDELNSYHITIREMKSITYLSIVGNMQIQMLGLAGNVPLSASST